MPGSNGRAEHEGLRRFRFRRRGPLRQSLLTFCPVDTYTSEDIVRQAQHVYLAEETKGERLDDVDFDLHFEEAFEAYWRAGARHRILKLHTAAVCKRWLSEGV